jgi:hypothetical protein
VNPDSGDGNIVVIYFYTLDTITFGYSITTIPVCTVNNDEDKATTVPPGLEKVKV